MSSPTPKSKCFLVMGVSGSGKSTIGESLATKLGVKFVDGDHLHPQTNIDKMSKNQPLNDEDRLPWLRNINEIIRKFNENNESAVVVCSALKKMYRNVLKNGARVVFVYLKSDFDTILERLKKRSHHFMPLTLLESQFQTLEEPDEEVDVVVIDVSESVDKVVEDCCKAVQKFL